MQYEGDYVWAEPSRGGRFKVTEYEAGRLLDALASRMSEMIEGGFFIASKDDEADAALLKQIGGDAYQDIWGSIL